MDFETCEEYTSIPIKESGSEYHRNGHFMPPYKSICFHFLTLLMKTISQRDESSHY